MKKWLDEEYEFEVEVIGFLRGDWTEHYCRNGEEIGDRYTCTYGCPVNAQGCGICSKVMMTLFPIMEAVRSGGDLENIGGDRWRDISIMELFRRRLLRWVLGVRAFTATMKRWMSKTLPG